jgi:hypothetical protein
MPKSSPNKPITSIITLLMMAFCCQTAAADVVPQVKTDKDIYNAGEAIQVNFFNSPGNQHDWICIVAAGSPDDDAGDYQYMPHRVSQGVLTFNAPPPGKYEVRAYYNYRRNGYVVSARYSFSTMNMASHAKPITSADKIKPLENQRVKAFSTSANRINGSVFHFTPLSMDVTNYGIAITNTLINALKMRSSFDMLGRKDLEIFLAANNLQQNDQTDNMIEIGTRLGLNFVIAGSIGKKGIAQRNVIFTNKITSMGKAELTNNIMKMSDSIIESILHSTN